MAVMVICALRDNVSESFGNPFVCANGPAAVRVVVNEALDNRPGNLLATHADNFELFELGAFDSLTGQLSVLQNPVSLGNIARSLPGA